MKWLADYFDLNLTERRGIIFLMILMILLLCLRVLLPVVLPKEQVSEEELARLDSVAAIIAERRSEYQEQASAAQPGKKLFIFDPNTASVRQLADLGLKEWQVKNIVNYRSKGGRFRKKEDLLKLHTIKEQDFNRLAPYLSLRADEKKAPSGYKQQEESFRREIQVVELNSADTLMLQELRGVGSYYARKIVTYRDRLGGFSTPQQLLEVYRIDPEVLDKNRDRIMIDESRVRKININTATADQLKRHPYISWQVANSLVKLREQQGPYTAIKDILKSVLITDSLYRKLAPYIKIDD